MDDWYRSRFLHVGARRTETTKQEELEEPEQRDEEYRREYRRRIPVGHNEITGPGALSTVNDVIETVFTRKDHRTPEEHVFYAVGSIFSAMATGCAALVIKKGLERFFNILDRKL